MKSWILNSSRAALLTSRFRPIARRNTDVLTTYGIVMRHSEGENLHNSPLCPCTYRVGPRRQRDWCSSHHFTGTPANERDARFRGNLTVPQAKSFPGHLKGLTLVIQHNYVRAYFDRGLQWCTIWPTQWQRWAIDNSSTKGLMSVNKASQTKKTSQVNSIPRPTRCSSAHSFLLFAISLPM